MKDPDAKAFGSFFMLENQWGLWMASEVLRLSSLLTK